KIYLQKAAGEVIVLVSMELFPGSFIPWYAYDLKEIGELKSRYSLKELKQQVPRVIWAVWADDLNQDEYEIAESAEPQFIVIYMRAGDGDATEELAKTKRLPYLVLHWGRIGQQKVLLGLNTSMAKLNEELKLQYLARDFSPAFYLAGRPPNKERYQLTLNNNIIDIYYDYCLLKLPKPGQCKAGNCLLPPGVIIIELECKNPGPFCAEQPGEVLLPKPPIPGYKPPAGGKQPKIKKKKIKQYDFSASYDVIIYGLTPSGIVTALTAAEAGAEVLIVEKNSPQQAGGFGKLAAQKILYASDLDDCRNYLRALRGDYDHLEDELIEAMATGLVNLPNWLTEYGAKQIYDTGYVQYEELPGGQSLGVLSLHEKRYNDRAFYNLLLENLIALKNKEGRYKQVKGTITYLYQTHLIEIIQDAKSKAIIGIEVEQKNKQYKLRAKRGLVIASGGFEANEEMVENFLQLPAALPIHDRTADGDGIVAARKLGADLWHMGNVAGYDLHFMAPHKLDVVDKRRALQGYYQDQLGDRACFVIGPNGRRFTDESAELRLGHVNFTGAWLMQEIPDRAWAIFDQAGLEQARLYPGWSADNSKELNKAWLIKADSIQELAKKLGVDEGNLEDQFLDYQDFCQQGYDSQWHSPGQYLKALSESGPYYALPLYPAIHHSLGGLRFNVRGEVLDIEGRVIPRLYTVGNNGSFFADILPEGADLAEGIVFGQIVGKEAAKKK
ncbi:MAG: FAD-binding protein, partial [Eubacteriales bacterium]|nr:FAD-binding protein [Eubacteriales bacterium]